MRQHTETGLGVTGPMAARRDAGRRADQAGRSAEICVTREYAQQGYATRETRWRGQGGEIDLIFGRDGVVVFTEVKKARSFDAAIASLRPAQIRRIRDAAAEYLAQTPEGQLSEVRFDLAVMDAAGEVRIIENAFGHF